MVEYLIIILANLLVGGMIGLTGIAGFLLPMLYSGFMGMPAAQGMALSFFAFLISGVLGAWNYHRAKNLDLRLGVLISAGSLIGASLGVCLNLLMDESVVKKILYLVVLASGISILLRKDRERSREGGVRLPVWALLAFGLVTGALCALSGAGGAHPCDAAPCGAGRAREDSGGSGSFQFHFHCDPILYRIQPAV